MDGLGCTRIQQNRDKTAIWDFLRRKAALRIRIHPKHFRDKQTKNIHRLINSLSRVDYYSIVTFHLQGGESRKYSCPVRLTFHVHDYIP